MRFLFLVFLVLLLFLSVIFAFLFVTSPYTFSRATPHDACMTNTADGKPVDLKFNGTAQTPFLLKPDVQRAQASLLHDWGKFCDDGSISWWITNETLLSAVRHGQMVPWADTVSVAILFSDLPKLVKLRAKIEKSGTQLLKAHKTGYTLCLNNFSQFPAIEVHVMTLRGEHSSEIATCFPLDELGQCSVIDPHKRRNEIFQRASILPLKTIALGNLIVPAPKNPDEVLLTRYGPNWRSETLYSPTRVVQNAHSLGWARRVAPNYF